MSKVIKQLKQTAQKVEKATVSAAKNAIKQADKTFKTVVGRNKKQKSRPRGKQIEISSTTSSNNSNNQHRTHRFPGSARRTYTRFETRGDSLILHRREMVQSVNGSTGFLLNFNELLNPTNIDLFKWAPQIATLFDEFEFLHVALHFHTNCGQSVSTQNVGRVAMGFLYDSDDPAPNSWDTLCNYGGIVDQVVYKDFSTTLKMDKTLFKTLYVNHSSTQDLSNPARLVFGTNGTQINTTIGWLWIDYSIRLSVPRTNNVSLFSTRHHTILGVTTWNDFKANPSFDTSWESEGWPLVTMNMANSYRYIEFNEPGLYWVRFTAYSTNASHAGTLAFGVSGGVYTAMANWPINPQSQKTTNGSYTIWTYEACITATLGANMNDGNVPCLVAVSPSGTTDSGVINYVCEVRCHSGANNSYIPTLSNHKTLNDRLLIQEKWMQQQPKVKSGKDEVINTGECTHCPVLNNIDDIEDQYIALKRLQNPSTSSSSSSSRKK